MLLECCSDLILLFFPLKTYCLHLRSRIDFILHQPSALFFQFLFLFFCEQANYKQPAAMICFYFGSFILFYLTISVKPQFRQKLSYKLSEDVFWLYAFRFTTCVICSPVFSVACNILLFILHCCKMKMKEQSLRLLLAEEENILSQTHSP